jgi:hypothetical protein
VVAARRFATDGDGRIDGRPVGNYVLSDDPERLQHDDHADYRIYRAVIASS